MRRMNAMYSMDATEQMYSMDSIRSMARMRWRADGDRMKPTAHGQGRAVEPRQLGRLLIYQVIILNY
jgi:hypothetical protein